jgi:hypothetical protein
MEKEGSRVIVGKGSFFLDPQGQPGSRCPVAKMF